MNNNVLRYLEESVKTHKNKTAFIDEHTKITFEETKKLSNIVSTEIINRIGYQNNIPILICLPKSIETIVSMLGIIYSGNFYTPTNVNFPEKKLLDVIQVLNPSLIITDSINKEKILSLGIEDNKIICYDLINKTPKEIKINTNKAIDTDLVYTYFTSGSTGIPKGVTINHKNIIDYIDWACDEFPIDENTIFGNQAALYFDISTQDIYATLKKAGTMVIIPEKLFAFPIKAVEFIKDKSINFLYWVPSAYVNLVNFKALDKISLDKIKSIMFGGEVMPVKHLNYLRKKIPSINFIANVYGPTEATVNSTYYIVNKEYEEHQSLPLGNPIKNKRILLLNKEDKLITKNNEKGELCVLGTSISPGYYKNSKSTGTVFVQNPLHDDFKDIMYRTGDLATYNEEGLLVFCGRKDNQIKHLGYRIELGEIEIAALAITSIDNCICLYNIDKRQIVLIYSSLGQDIIDREIKIKLVKVLPKFMVPTKYIKIDNFPLNNNGKIDRLLLKNLHIRK